MDLLITSNLAIKMDEGDVILCHVLTQGILLGGSSLVIRANLEKFYVLLLVLQSLKVCLHSECNLCMSCK